MFLRGDRGFDSQKERGPESFQTCCVTKKTMSTLGSWLRLKDREGDLVVRREGLKNKIRRVSKLKGGLVIVCFLRPLSTGSIVLWKERFCHVNGTNNSDRCVLKTILSK